jgi:hypothetical protein
MFRYSSAQGAHKRYEQTMSIKLIVGSVSAAIYVIPFGCAQGLSLSTGCGQNVLSGPWLRLRRAEISVVKMFGAFLWAAVFTRALVGHSP